MNEKGYLRNTEHENDNNTLAEIRGSLRRPASPRPHQAAEGFWRLKRFRHAARRSRRARLHGPASDAARLIKFLEEDARLALAGHFFARGKEVLDHALRAKQR